VRNARGQEISKRSTRWNLKSPARYGQVTRLQTVASTAQSSRHWRRWIVLEETSVWTQRLLLHFHSPASTPYLDNMICPPKCGSLSRSAAVAESTLPSVTKAVAPFHSPEQTMQPPLTTTSCYYPRQKKLVPRCSCSYQHQTRINVEIDGVDLDWHLAAPNPGSS
jgi:hypothetical protein